MTKRKALPELAKGAFENFASQWIFEDEDESYRAFYRFAFMSGVQNGYLTAEVLAKRIGEIGTVKPLRTLRRETSREIQTFIEAELQKLIDSGELKAPKGKQL